MAEWCGCGDYLMGTAHRCSARVEWCDSCQDGDHGRHTDSSERCANDNTFNADCKCPTDRSGRFSR